ncbi:Alpha/Beta hydrolase protein [Pelagophyceae sp. CCMP2097]|nr:Alpha/Beta hydrolase protein [Pelagophyceae sp. CCMP2097]|mmetsp:Transcript_15590/g.52553  ORF Transcript_15590/g.52553 Transcript_15590/m.52553 type:complete len:328 (-) Transcript_15590:21-1004(-)
MPFAKVRSKKLGDLLEVNLEYITSGALGAPCVLLVCDMGVQRVEWAETFVAHIVSCGFRVVCYDQRDVGLSTHLNHYSSLKNQVSRIAACVHKGSLKPVYAPAYTLEDLAGDALRLLDELHIDAAHVFGRGMGGAVAQHMALLSPRRVASLTLALTSSGLVVEDAIHADEPNLKVHVRRLHYLRRFVFNGVKHESVVERSRKRAELHAAVSDMAYVSEATLRNILAAESREPNPSSRKRHWAAHEAQPDRTPALSGLNMPCCVVHGTQDRFVPFVAAVQTANAIPHCELYPLEHTAHTILNKDNHLVAATVVRTARRTPGVPPCGHA